MSLISLFLVGLYMLLIYLLIISDKFNSLFIESNNKEHNDFFKNNSIILRSNLIWDLILLMEHMNEDQ